MPYVTRFAPSPTGDFHTGSARTALLSYLAARSSGGRFVLRIDDTDAARNDPAAVDVIFDAMNWLGLDHDDLFYQSKRSDIYAAARDLLLAADKAYLDDGAVKLRLPDDLGTSWTDAIKGPINISDHDRKLIDGLVLFRSDGSPTYHFASSVDDLDMGVNFVIRGTDHIGNAPKHVAIRSALIAAGFVPVVKSDDLAYAHVGLIDIIDADGKRKKMSKRDAAASLLKYRDGGYLPEALIDYMMRGKGWAHSVHDFDKKNPMISLADAITHFPDGKLKSSPSLLDTAALAKADRKWKAAKGIVHFGRDTVA